MDLVNRKKVNKQLLINVRKRRFGLNSEDIDKENSSNDGTNLEDEIYQSRIQMIIIK